MENLEETFSTSTKFQDIENIKGCHYADGISCVITECVLCVFNEKIHGDSGRMYSIDMLDHSLKFVHYLSIQDLIFVATDLHLIICNRLTGDTDVKWTFESKIIALSWSPHQACLVVINTDYEIFLLTFDSAELKFGLAFQSHLYSHVPVSSVNVGWGVPSAQFRGPRNITTGNPVDAPVENVVFEEPPSISWRGSGEQFLVNFLKNDHRIIKVFSRQLIPEFESDKYDGLGPLTAFKYFGYLFACFAVGRGSNELIFFEKNCKILSTSPCSETVGHIKRMEFHPQMNMLATLSFDYAENSIINIYLAYNGKWYLKQQLLYPPEQKVKDFYWAYDENKSFTTCKIVIFTNQGVDYRLFRFILSRNELNSTVLVTDGRYIYHYQFIDKFTAEPICTIKSEAPVNKIIFHRTEPWCLLVDPTTTIRLLALQPDTFISQSSKRNSLVNLIDIEQFDILPEYEGPDIIKLDPRTVNDSQPLFRLRYTDTNDDSAWYKTIDDDSGRNIFYLSKRKFNINDTEASYEFTLDDNLHLFINANEVCSGVTSFMGFKNYLFFTTEEGMLYIVPVRQLSVLENNFNLNELFSISIDCGARIVHCNNTLSAKIILQAPRGNLEVQSCVVMTIDLIESLLQKDEWDEAVFILSQEGINCNVLIDLNPKRFCENLENFVKAAESWGLLESMVTEINIDENCFDTIYKNYLAEASPAFEKQEVIFNIIKYFVSTDSVKNLKYVASIHAKYNTLVDAVKSIKDVYTKKTLDAEQAAFQALKQLLLTVDFNRVIAEIYSLYDIDFLCFAFENSNEDPDVYYPIIFELKHMESNEQRFHMNVRAGNVKKATKYLLRGENFHPEFVERFLETHKLEYVAYHSISKYHVLFKLVSQCYALRLQQEQNYLDAGYIYKRAGFLPEALLEYKKALDWREVIMLLQELNYSEAETMEVLDELADRLLAVKKLDEAITILEHYTRNHQKAVNALIEFKEFRKAFFYYRAHNESITWDEILFSLEEYLRDLWETVEQHSCQFHEYLVRLEELRVEKCAVDDRTVDDSLDVYSETATNSSRTVRSSMSAKSLRKDERRKFDLRKGGRYEDIALKRALFIMYQEVLNVWTAARDVFLLEEHFSSEYFSTLLPRIENLKMAMTESVETIWPGAPTTLEGVGSNYDGPPYSVLDDPSWKQKPM